jgi:hypothetical protein
MLRNLMDRGYFSAIAASFNVSLERTPFAHAHGLRPTGAGAANPKPRWHRTSPHCGGVAQLGSRYAFQKVGTYGR